MSSQEGGRWADISLPTMQGIPHFHKKGGTQKALVHAPTIPVVPYFNPTSFALSSTLFVT
jgi:hypothetical protein